MLARMEGKIPYKPQLQNHASWLRKNLTISEIILWQKLKGKQLLGCKFIRQKPILKYIVDFYCKELKLVIEIDGISHGYKINYDLIRQKDIETAGLHVLRFNDEEVKQDSENVIQQVVDWINQHTPVALGDHPSS